MRLTCARLTQLTHNSVHIVTPFDSGGSSAAIRQGFHLPSVGDIRNRLVALADPRVMGSGAVQRLFTHRLPNAGDHGGDRESLAAAMAALAAGNHPLLAPCPDPVREVCGRYLQVVWDRAPEAMDFAGASIGNLVLTGACLAEDRDLDRAMARIAPMLRVLGHVVPSSRTPAHLVAELADGSRIVGQHHITAPESAGRAPIRRLGLCGSLEDPSPIAAPAHPDALDGVAASDLICLPMGSFWTSVMANLLPDGMVARLATASAPLVFVPGIGRDPELRGMSVVECLRVIADAIGRPVDGILVDTERGDYGVRLDPGAVAALGVQVLDTALIGPADLVRHEGTRVAEALVALT